MPLIWAQRQVVAQSGGPVLTSLTQRCIDEPDKRLEFFGAFAAHGVGRRATRHG
jgi:hypothetical protein